MVNYQRGDPRVVDLLAALKEKGLRATEVADVAAVPANAGQGRGEHGLVLIADPVGDEELARAVVSTAEERRFDFLVYVGEAMSADLYKRLMRTKCGDWVRWSALESELEDVLARMRTEPAEVSGSTAAAFVPSKGGVGNTTLLVETAIALSHDKKSGGRVAVLDLNFQGSTLGDLMDVEARFDVTEIMNAPDRIDPQIIGLLATSYSPALDVFAAPEKPIAVETVGPDSIFALVDQMSRLYRHLLIDMPSTWSPWHDVLTQGCDVVLVVGESTVPCVRRLACRYKHVAEISGSAQRRGLVVNQCRTDVFGRIVQRAEIERALGEEQIFFVPREEKGFVEAANAGRPLMEDAPRRPACRTLASIARFIGETAAAPTAKVA